MNKIFTRFFLRRAILQFRPRSIRSLLLGMTFGGMFWIDNCRRSLRPVKMEMQHFENELIILNKNDYFDRVLGNETDFFFLIVYNDNHDTLQEATKAAKLLKDLGETNGYKKWNIYLISRTVFSDIKKIMGRVKNVNLFDGEAEYPIEVYLKSPHSRDFFYIHFKRNKFYDERGIKRTLLKMNRIKNLIEKVEFEEDFKLKLLNNANKFNIPTLVVAIDDTDPVAYKKLYKKYAKLAFLSIERKFFPIQSRFLLVSSNLASKLGIEKNCFYLLKNDAVTAYERYSGIEIDDNSNCLELDVYNPSVGKVHLKKYDNSILPILRTQKANLPDDKKKELKTKEIIAFMSFILPRVFMIQDLKYRSMGQLARKLQEDRSKLIISLYCPFNDPIKDKKLEIFMKLYKKYQDKFLFCIFGSEAAEDMFPHAKPIYPSFTAFNFFNLKKDYEPFNKYYKNLVYSYEKYFLNPNSMEEPNEAEIEERLQKIVNKEADWDFLDNRESSILELRGGMHKNFLENFNKGRDDAIIIFTDDSKNSKTLLHEVEKLTDQIPAKFYKVTHRNTSDVFPILRRYPYVIRLSNKDKKMTLLEDRLLTNEKALAIYLQNLYRINN